MDQAEAEAWARDWVESWNSHDLTRLLEHFSEDAFFSPLVPVITGNDNPLQGDVYWTEGLRRLPQLHFSLQSVYVGAGTIAIAYGNERDQDCLEVLEVGADSLARRGLALYHAPTSAASPEAPR